MNQVPIILSKKKNILASAVKLKDTSGRLANSCTNNLETLQLFSCTISGKKKIYYFACNTFNLQMLLKYEIKAYLFLQTIML